MMVIGFMDNRQLILHLLVDNIYWRMEYDDANPDVGFGPTTEMIYDDAIKDLKLQYLNITPKEKSLVIRNVQRRRQNYEK